LDLSIEPIVKLEHPSAKAFLIVLEVLGNIVDEALFTFTDEGLLVRALDPAKVALIDISIPSSAFLEYSISRNLGVGVNLTFTLKTLPTPKKTDKLVLLANDEFYELIIEGTGIKRYKYRSIEVSATEIPEIQLDFKVRALIVSHAFRTAIKDLKGVGSIAFVTEDSDNLYLKAAEGGVQVRLSKVGGSIIDMEVQEPSKCVYDEDYIVKVLDLAGVTESIELKFGNDLPLNLYFTLVDGGSVKYLLAPKA